MNAPDLIEFDEPRLARFTAAQVMEMANAGLFADRRFELIDGVLLEMSPQNSPHSNAIIALTEFLVGARPPGFRIGVQVSLFLTEHTIVEPDFAVLPVGFDLADANGAEVPLVVEVSDSTLSFDLGRKAELYAAQGFPNYWVVDVAKGRLHRHAGPAAAGYASCIVSGFDQPVNLPYAPDVSLNLAELLES